MTLMKHARNTVAAAVPQKLDCVSDEKANVDATLFAKRLRNDLEASFRAPDSRGLIKSARPLRATTTTTINTRIIENNALKRSCRPETRVHAITRLPGATPNRSFFLSFSETGGKGYFTSGLPLIILFPSPWRQMTRATGCVGSRDSSRQSRVLIREFVGKALFLENDFRRK